MFYIIKKNQLFVFEKNECRNESLKCIKTQKTRNGTL